MNQLVKLPFQVLGGGTDYGTGLIKLAAFGGGAGLVALPVEFGANGMPQCAKFDGNFAVTDAPHSPPPPPLPGNKIAMALDNTMVLKIQNGFIITKTNKLVPFFPWAAAGAPDKVAKLFGALQTAMAGAGLASVSFHVFNVEDPGGGALNKSTVAIPV